MTGLGTGFRETQEESSFLSWAAGDAGLSLHRTPPGFLFLFTPLPLIHLEARRPSSFLSWGLD